MAQLDLFGARKRAFRFGRIFGPRAGKHDSKAEARIAGFLEGRGISYRRHALILPAHARRKRAFSEKEKEGIVRSAGLPAESLALVLKKAPLARIRPELFRCDFVVEGISAGKPARVFIEYLGLHKPAMAVTPKLLRRRHNRQAAIYTFLKVPLKKALYEKAGLDAVFLEPGDLGLLDEKLAEVIRIRQERSTLKSGPVGKA